MIIFRRVLISQFFLLESNLIGLYRLISNRASRIMRKLTSSHCAAFSEWESVHLHLAILRNGDFQCQFHTSDNFTTDEFLNESSAEKSSGNYTTFFDEKNA